MNTLSTGNHAWENFFSIQILHLLTLFKFRGLPVALQQFAAAVGVLLISPLLLIVAVAIRLESRGPVIFTQVRVGKNGEEFKLYKFRSMYMSDDPRYVDTSGIKSDREGVCRKILRDPRITCVGRTIRKYSLDELPQLLNVVLGKMVLVGPRPALPCEVAEYDLKARKRLLVKPGLTGLWQVSGRADTTFDEQIELDVSYVKAKSLLLDIKILMLTVPAVLSARGAY